jgi:hypothetical protein
MCDRQGDAAAAIARLLGRVRRAGSTARREGAEQSRRVSRRDSRAAVRDLAREAGAFDLVYAATAWHWVDPSIRYEKAHDLLRAGGHLAFWSALHACPEDFDPFFTEIQAVYDAIGESHGGDWPPAPPEQEPDFADEIERSGLFEDVRVRRYVWERRYSADEYIALLETFSGHISMEADKREHLYREIRTKLGTRSLRRHWYAILHVARSKT